MSETATTAPSVEAIELTLRDELAQGDAMLETITPIMRHLLANDDASVFSDEIVARVRGMASDLARQLLDALVTASGEIERRIHPEPEVAALTLTITENPAFLGHLHALAIEWQLTERLQARLALDPVLAPLLQALIASPEGHVADQAIRLLASQARFCQSQRRMRHPLNELPGDLLHAALLGMRTLAGTEAEANAVAARAEAAIRAGYDESASRLGLIARLVSGMGGGAIAALSVTHAGTAMFVSALSMASGQDRDIAVLSTNEAQLARLVLALRAGGQKPAGIAEQLFALHPEVELPEGFERLGADRAAAILSVAGSYSGG